MYKTLSDPGYWSYYEHLSKSSFKPQLITHILNQLTKSHSHSCPLKEGTQGSLHLQHWITDKWNNTLYRQIYSSQLSFSVNGSLSWRTASNCSFYLHTNSHCADASLCSVTLESFLPLSKPPLRRLITFFSFLPFPPSPISVTSFILSFLFCLVCVCVCVCVCVSAALPFFFNFFYFESACIQSISVWERGFFFCLLRSCILGHPVLLLLGQSQETDAVEKTWPIWEQGNRDMNYLWFAD